MSEPQWKSLTYYNPTKVLTGMDELFTRVGIRKYRNPADILLKQRRLRPMSEVRRCALFLHGASQAFGRQILFAEHESSDYDYVATYEVSGRRHWFPVQLKQLVPSRLNPTTTLQTELDKLAKYVASSKLVVAIHVNREVHVKPWELRVSHLPVKEIWLFAQYGKQSTTWLLLGNLKASTCNAYKFNVPAA